MKRIDFTVRDAHIARDVILSFYGMKQTQNDWRYRLETVIFRNYLLFDNDPTELFDLTIPEWGFEILLEAMSVHDISKNNTALNLIRKNKPEQYNIQKLSNELRKYLLKTDTLLVIDNKLNIWNAKTNERIIALPDDRIALPDEISNDENKSAKCWFTVIKETINALLDYGISQDHIAISNDGQIVAVYTGTSIRIWIIGSGQMIHELFHDLPIKKLLMSRNHRFLGIVDNKNCVKIWNTYNWELNYKSELHQSENYELRIFEISDDGRYVVINSLRTIPCINIWDTHTDSQIHNSFCTYKHIRVLRNTHLVRRSLVFESNVYDILNNIKILTTCYTTCYAISNDDNFLVTGWEEVVSLY